MGGLEGGGGGGGGEGYVFGSGEGYVSWFIIFSLYDGVGGRIVGWGWGGVCFSIDYFCWLEGV